VSLDGRGGISDVSVPSLESEKDDHGLVVLSPAARLTCDPDIGELYLTRVGLSAWQVIDLPHQWDNPDREPDPWPEAQ